MKRFRSILSRVVAPHVVAIGVTSILMPLALYWLLNEAANSLHRDTLRGQAFTIAGFLRPTADGGVTLDIPQEAEPIYSGGYGLYAYAILDSKGKVLFASRHDDAPLSAANDSLTSDSFTKRRSNGTVFIGVDVPYWTRAPACPSPSTRRSSSDSGGATARGSPDRTEAAEASA